MKETRSRSNNGLVVMAVAHREPSSVRPWAGKGDRAPLPQLSSCRGARRLAWKSIWTLNLSWRMSRESEMASLILVR